MAEANLTKSADIDVTVREIDFVTRFNQNWEHLREIMGIMRPIKKAPGTKLTSKIATVDLQDGAVAEGDTIPYSHATVVETAYSTINIEKFAKAVSIEAIDEKGYENAIQKTDDEFLKQLQDKVTDKFYAFLQTGTLTSTEGTFQMALAMAQGRVKDRWKKMHKSSTSIVGFCNILDAYAYLGAANITVQNQFGMDYIENFLGYSKLFLTSEIPQGKVIATPSENIVLYYIDPNDSAFAKAGLVYRTDGETNLIGFHVDGNYRNAVSESFALMGMVLFAEYLDGIAVVSIGEDDADLSALAIGNLKLTPEFTTGITNYTAKTTAATNTISATADDSSATIVIKNGDTTVTNGGSATWATGENTVTVTVTSGTASKVYTVKVTKS